MRNNQSAVNTLGRLIALLTFSFVASPVCASPSAGEPVQNTQGQLIGSILGPVNESPRLKPSVVIQLNDGEKKVKTNCCLTSQGDSLVLNESVISKSDNESAIEAAFEVRAMTMVMIMQSHEDTRLLGDVTDLVYDLHDNTLHIRGSLDSVDSFHRVLNVTIELCDYEIAPDITIRRPIVPS
ncbi:hypothetical protein [Cerasicoccus arenae]|uniref:Uncharacterized protein n=1 Tax=Cerasicoccus arenae TaxID=424488 RepID=A0A8J3DBD6_9BACT|nr:hypothetical protein [Cerasicoccus arenae]MBK1857922.1 hypothetical protein [Cerasicoccus arenae]GHC00734.1 hypothetical protein GCM10007047_16500 [Cerasicoccus arenae]